MAISDEQIEEIRAKVDIADLVSSYGFSLRQSGSDLWCCCPFHNEKTPSFKVDSSRGNYHCFGCGESGDIFDFVQKQDGLSFIEAVRKLASRAGVELKESTSPNSRLRHRLYELMATISIDFNRMLKSTKNKDGELAREYLKKRQLDADIVDKFLIGYAPSDVDKILGWANKHGYTVEDLAAAGLVKLSEDNSRKPYFYFANRLVFTIKDKNGQVVAFSGRQLVEDKHSGKYVNSPETLIFKKSRNFFAFDEARKNIVKAPNREAIICEGQIDCIRLHSSGYNTAVAPLGTAFTEDHAVLLHRVADSAVLCFDDDGAGHKATIRTARILLAEGMPIRVVSLDQGDDPDSYILKHGKESFGELLRSKSESIVEFQIRAEMSKETDKDDSNAIVRVTKAVLETIAKCKDNVQRDVLLKEASKRLNIDYGILAKDIANDVQVEKVASSGTAEQLIDEPIVNDVLDAPILPNTTEGALANYLYSNEGDIDIISCIDKLIPKEILSSPSTVKIVESFEKYKSGDEDPIRDAVESLSVNEYRNFLSSIINMDYSVIAEIPKKNILVYFARQIWHEFFVRQLVSHKNDAEVRSYLAKKIKELHNSTIKGVVNMITTFPLQDVLKK